MNYIITKIFDKLIKEVSRQCPIEQNLEKPQARPLYKSLILLRKLVAGACIALNPEAGVKMVAGARLALTPYGAFKGQNQANLRIDCLNMSMGLRLRSA